LVWKQGQASWKQSTVCAGMPIKPSCTYMTGVCSLGMACIEQAKMSSIQALQSVVHDSVLHSVMQANSHAAQPDHCCPPGRPRSSFNDVALHDCQNCRIGRTDRDAQDRLLWRDKTCPALMPGWLTLHSCKGTLRIN